MLVLLGCWEDKMKSCLENTEQCLAWNSIAMYSLYINKQPNSSHKWDQKMDIDNFL